MRKEQMSKKEDENIAIPNIWLHDPKQRLETETLIIALKIISLTNNKEIYLDEILTVSKGLTKKKILKAFKELISHKILTEYTDHWLFKAPQPKGEISLIIKK